MNDEFLKEVGNMAKESLDETIKELAEEDKKRSNKTVPDPLNQFWYALLGAYVSKVAEKINGVPTATISLYDLNSIKDCVVTVSDSPGKPGEFIVKVQK